MEASFLSRTQQRLSDHFRVLARTRERRFPIFALEHGLDEGESDQLRQMLRERAPSADRWLLWVAYATEEGYGYDGDEYWDSFEARTARWEYLDRARIRAWFRKFHRTYGGVVPSGPWAEHFSIIAWPITHAILPRYLQRQLAKLLYDVRFRLASLTTPDARRIGRLLSSNAADEPARFRAFLEQEQLTGQIVGALLGGEVGDGRLVYPATLQRIVADLEKTRQAGTWLRETRRVVADRFQGIGHGSGSGGERAHRRIDLSRLAIRPSLSLRHVGGGRWSVFVDVRSFRPVAALNREVQSFLERTRCRLNGADDWKPRRWLLSGDRQGALRSWPDPRAPIIGFEQRDAMMEHLLETECRVPPGPVWLFKVGEDGIARHVAAGAVRPERDYILVATSLRREALDGMESCEVDCDDATGYRLTMPSHVSTEMTSALKGMGLQVARTIRVWPAGLPGRHWDGEGSSEWLTTESPCLGIAADHAVESLVFSLDGGPRTEIPTEGGSGPLFVRMRPLLAGEHVLTVEARRSAELEELAQNRAAVGSLRLAVREPEPWTPGVTSHPGLIVRVNPDDGDLESLWRNRVAVTVNGPKGFSVAIRVALLAADGGEICSERLGTPLPLPVTAKAWHGRFARFLSDEGRATRYLDATSCTVGINGETLGTCTLRFEREPVPVRWVVRNRGSDLVARLVDDTGEEGAPPDVRFYGMARPLQATKFRPDQAATVVEPPGGLFVASHGEHRDAVVVSAHVKRGGLQDLGVRSMFPDLRRNSEALTEYFRVLKTWRDARLSGFLATVRHRGVMEGMADALLGLLCGENWAMLERQRSRQADTAIRGMTAIVNRGGRFGDLVRSEAPRCGTVRLATDWLVDAAHRRGLCRIRGVCEFALHLARSPLMVVDNPNVDAMLRHVAANPPILRAARLLTLLADREWRRAEGEERATSPRGPA